MPLLPAAIAIVLTFAPVALADIVIVSSSKQNKKAVYGKRNVDNLCERLLPSFRCSRTWPSGARGVFPRENGTEVSVASKIRHLNKLRADIARISPHVRTPPPVFNWTVQRDTPLAGPGGERRIPHVTSQSDFSDFFIERQLQVLETPESAGLTLSDPAVQKVQKNAPRHLRQIAGTEFGDPDETFRFQRFSTGVNVYVVDGILTEGHDEFRNLFDGRVRVSPDRFSSPLAQSTFDSDPECSSAHGTHVGSLAAGYGYGIAKNSTLISVGVQPGCDQNGFASDLLQGLSWILDHYLAQPKPRMPAIATMSLLLERGDAADEVERVVQDLLDAGVIVTVAAGNYQQDACEFVPARMPGVITVGAVDEYMRYAWSWSNFGDCVDIWSPGENILGASPTCTKCTAVFSGTSQATPIVAGAVAHLLEQTPDANVDDIKDMLRATGSTNFAPPADSTNLLLQFRE